jgi:hypothetical protein
LNGVQTHLYRSRVVNNLTVGSKGKG